MNDHLKKIVKNFKDKRIIVWGDFILDEYIYTTSSRVSREAPVLVTEFDSNMYLLGGAGNVVMNIKTLGAIPIPVGFIGPNEDGRTLVSILEEKGITTEYLLRLEGFRTPKKSRILSGGVNTKKQQVLRIDTLNKMEIQQSANEQMEEILISLLKETDYLIISDYLFKSITPAGVGRLRKLYPGKIFIADSRYHLPQFKDISYATPNEPEFKRIFSNKHFIDEQEYLEVGHALRQQLNAEGIILKRGHKGMMVFQKDQDPEIIGIHGSSDIVDVTGAGDTVISVLSLALAAGADFVSSAKLANIAAGFVVMKAGVYPISTKELLNELN